jgi:hypothetical protein
MDRLLCNSMESGPPPTMENEASTSLSRRRFLAVLALGAAAGVQSEIEDSSLSWLLFKPDADDIPSEVPAELAQTPIDSKNEHYQPNPVAFLTTAIDTYKQNGGTPFYRKPPYYMSRYDAVIAGVSTPFRAGKGRYPKEASYSILLNFSRLPYERVNTLYDIDPGSSTQREVKKRLAEAQLPAGPPMQVSSESTAPLTNRDTIIAQSYRDTFAEAKAHIDGIRGQGRVSTSELFAYYLHRSGGDIVTSLIDTTVFLKMAARVDMDKLAAIADEPSRLAVEDTENADVYGGARKQADLVASMFYDDFSHELPLESLTKIVPEDSDLNDIVLTSDCPLKNFDPVNRAGLPYHVWSLFLMSACADAAAVKKIVSAYFGSPGVEAAQGSIKVAADTRIAAQASDIQSALRRYAVL